MRHGVPLKCKLTSSAAVARAFGGHVSGVTVKTSGLGNPLCIFTLSTSNVQARGTVTMSADSSSTMAEFRSVQRQLRGRTVNGLADSAFYVDNTSTMQFRHDRTSVVVQATMKVRAGTKYATKITSDVTAVSRAIVAEL